MKCNIKKAVRILALTLIICATGSAFATECLFSNVDAGTTAATAQDGKYATKSITFNLSDLSANAISSTTFPSSGTALITQINLCSRSDNDKKNAAKVRLMGSTSGRVFSGTVVNLNADTTMSINENPYTRKIIQILFDEGAIPVNVTETYTLLFYNGSWGAVEEGYSVVKKSDGDWKPAMRIYGATLTSSPETVLSGTPRTVDSSGVSFLSGGSLSHYSAFMRVSNIPESSGRIFAWKDGAGNEMYLSKTATGFEQRWMNSSGTINASIWGSGSWSHDTGDHWVAVTYDESVKNTSDVDVKTANGLLGSHSYIDGTAVADSDGLRFRGKTIPTLTIGGANANNTDVATGMVIKEAYQCSESLTAAQVATVTAALAKGWTLNSSGTVLNGTDKEIPDGTNRATGSIIVAADGTYTFAEGTTLTGTNMELPGGGANITGTIVFAVDGSYAFPGPISVLSGTVTVPSGATVTAVAEGATVLVTTSTAPATLNAAITGNYTIAGSLTVPENVEGSIILVDSSGNVAIDAESSWNGGVLSFTGTAPVNPTYTGSLWLWDYEFNGTVVSIGSDTATMTTEGDGDYYTAADASGNKELYLQKTPYRGASFSSYPAMTAVMYCQPGNYSNKVLVGFGTKGGYAIALVTGDNPASGEMKLVLNNNNAVTTLATLKAVDATTKKHLYAFVMDRVTESETEKTRVRVYLDGKVKAIYKHSGTLTLSNGFQIGSVHGGVPSGLAKYPASGNSGMLDFLRIVNGSLTDDAMATLANAYPYSSANGEATRTAVSGSANWVATDVWTQSVPGSEDAQQSQPNTSTNVKLPVGGSSEVSVAINLTSDSNYESLTFEKATGATGSLKLTSSQSTTGKLVSAESSILVDTVIPAGCVALGNASIADGVTLTVDPYSADNHGVIRRLEALGFGETYEDVIISMAILGQGASVVLGDQTALTALGFTATLTYEPSNQSYTLRITREAASVAGNIAVTADAEGNVTWVEFKGVAMPQPDSLPAGYSGMVTVNAGAYAGTITIPTMFYGGTLKVASGSVDFTGTSTVSYDVSGTLNLAGPIKASVIQFTGSGTVNCSSANTLQGTIKGAAAITIRYPEHALPVEGAIWTDAEWRGTNVFTNCGHLKVTGQGRVPFDKYGSVNSFICAPGFRGYAAKAVENDEIPYCAATLVVDGTDVFEFNHGDDHIIGADVAAGIKFKAIVGSGKLLLDGESDIAQYIFNDVSGFTGNVEITDPNPGQVAGGKKSFIFGLPENWPVDTAFPANLVLAAGAAKVADGKEWDVPAGIVLNGNSVLNLGAGSTITVLDKRSTGTLAVPSGSATLTNVMDSVMRTKLSIGTEAQLNITDTSLTALTIPADTNVASRTYWNDGLLNLTGCTALTDLYLILGEAKTFDLSKVRLPSSCTNIYYNIGEKRNLSGYSLPTVDDGTNVCFYAVETGDEYANGGFVASNVVAGADLWLIRRNGALIHTAVSNTNDRVYAGGRSFAGAACWHEWDFEQGGKTEFTEKLNDSGSFSTNESPTGVVGLLATVEDVERDYTFINVPVQGEDKCGISIATYPYPSDEIPFGDTWSAAVRCTMPSEANKVAIAFGDTTGGILGLASGAQDDIVELFSWTNNVYTALAQLQVESATNMMHIYVFTVTKEDSKNYVALYRDGEFIHKAQFALTGTIAKFKVGDVIYTGERAQTLPGVATSGFVDYVRLYDKVLPESDIQGLSSRRPFVSAINLFERTPAQLGASWSDADAWLKTEGVTAIKSNATTPDNGANVTVTVDGSPTVVMNLDSDYAYGTLIFKGTGSLGLSQRSTGKIGAEMLVVRTGVDLTVDHDAVCFTGAIVNVDPGASLKFDVSGFPFGDVKTAETNFYITGAVPARAGGDETVDTRITLTGVPAHTWSVMMAWDSTALRYKVTVAPDHNPGAEIYYKSGYITSGMTGDGGANVGTVFKNADLTEKTTLFAGDTVVISDNSLDPAANNAWISDTFNGDIKVTRSVLNLRPGSNATSAILDRRTITVESDKTLNLYKQGDKTFAFGSLTLAGGGTVNFIDEATVATLTSSIDTLTVADGKTLTVTTLALPADTPVTVGSLLLKVSGKGTVNLSGVTVGGTPTPLKWVRKTVGGIDGIYVISGTFFSVY